MNEEEVNIDDMEELGEQPTGFPVPTDDKSKTLIDLEQIQEDAGELWAMIQHDPKNPTQHSSRKIHNMKNRLRALRDMYEKR